MPAAALAEAHPHEHGAALDVLEGDAGAQPARQLRESWLLLRLSPITQTSRSAATVEGALERHARRARAAIEPGPQSGADSCRRASPSGVCSKSVKYDLSSEELDVEVRGRVPRSWNGPT